jgi:hypothetical protein
METVEPGLFCYLAEWYRPDLNAEAVDDAIAQLKNALGAVGANGASAQLLVVLAAPDDEVLYGLFSASSPGVVVQVCIAAGYPIERLTADVHARLLQP